MIARTWNKSYILCLIQTALSPTFQIPASLFFSSTPEVLEIHDHKYGNIIITHVAENGSVFTISTNCLDTISGALKDSKEALHGDTGKGTKNKVVHTSSGGFPTSPVKHATTCTAASFILNH